MRFTRNKPLVAACVLLFLASASTRAQVAEPPRISAEDLVKALQLPKPQQPLVIQVGFRIMFQQAHIPGAEYIGPGSEATVIEQLRKRVQALPRDRFVVLYCGCCPWERCPNVKPAATEMAAMGFKNMKVLYIANNFGSDWADKGYPVEKGE